METSPFWQVPGIHGGETGFQAHSRACVYLD